LADALASGAVEKSLAAIARENDRFRAITHLDPADARARAAAIDASTDDRPLLGLTFVVKDLIDVAGMPTTGGSKLFAPGPAAEDAPIVRDLQAAGAVVVGKSNMHELAVGGARNPWFGQVVNPLSAAYGTGGTSSGSVAAVAAGFVDFALGTDSGGSNRSTAAATGLYGFKPANGTLSLEGIRPVAPTLDTVGLLAKDGALLARVFAALVGQQPHEGIILEGRIIARPIGLHGPVDSCVDAALEFAAETIRAGGGRIGEIEFSDAAALREAGREILLYEFSKQYGADIAENPDRVGEDVQAFLAIARKVSALQYDEALALVSEHRQRWHRQLRTVDALMLPSAPGLAPRLEDEHTRVGDTWVAYGAAGAELRMWANSIGIPAVAIPVTRPGGLPASIQLAGRPNADSFLLDLSAALGRAIGEQCAAHNQGELR
jgi:Asp-tRNA(Asn)/Glu-tRNA(Gln) amidotransferase A subunit family amidase